MGLVDRESLGAGCGDGVAELDVLGDVGGGQADGAVIALGVAVIERPDPHRSVGPDRGDVPEGAVADVPVIGAQPTVVAAGHDAIPDGGGEPVVQEDTAGG